MSAFRVSRRAAEESSRIAAFQFFAAMAAFPAEYSGSSCPSLGASSLGSAEIFPGSELRPTASPTRATKILTPITSLLAGQPLLRLAQLRPVAVRVPRQPGKLLEVLTRLLHVTGGFGRLGGAVEASQPHRRVLERRLVFLQGGHALALGHEHVGQEFTHRVEAASRGPRLLSGILQVSRRAHELDGVGLVALALGDPRLGSQNLDLDLSGPVALTRLLQCRALLPELVDVGLGGSHG